MPTWSTACPDWEERIVQGRPLIPFPPLFPAEAEAALAIMREMRIVDMPNSPRRKDVCRPWVFDLAGALFGSYDHDAGERLIQYYMLLVAKKNDKSGTAAGLMVTALLRNWRPSGEFYILAPEKETADNAFRPAADMIRADENLLSLLHIQDNLKTITHRLTDATLKVVSDEVVTGKKTIGLLIEELWKFGKRAGAADMMREAQGGLAARPEGFAIYVSTHSDEPPRGVFQQKLNHFRDVRDGVIEDPRSLPILYEYPKGHIERKLYLDRKTWHIPNPNLNASVREQFLVERFAEAERAGPAELNGFLAKHLNVEIGQALRADGWAGAKLWERGIEKGLTLQQVIARSEVITVGFDGGGLDDLLGIGVIGRERDTKRWLAWTRALISKEGMDRRKANQTIYEQFIQDGDLILIDSLPDDLANCVDVVVEIQDAGLLAQVGVDAAGIGGLVDALAQVDVTQDAEKLGAVKQGIALMGAIKTIERKLADRTFVHGGQALMSWCVGNAIIVPTPTAMRIDRAESGFGKIDPLMALFNAAALMSMNPGATGRHFWEVA